MTFCTKISLNLPSKGELALRGNGRTIFVFPVWLETCIRTVLNVCRLPIIRTLSPKLGKWAGTRAVLMPVPLSLREFDGYSGCVYHSDFILFQREKFCIYYCHLPLPNGITQKIFSNFEIVFVRFLPEYSNETLFLRHSLL